MSRRTRFKYMVMAIRPGGGNYGDDFIQGGETPVAIQTSGCELTPFAGEELDRNLDDGRSGASQVLMVGTHVKIKAPVELAGSGTNITPVAFSPLLQICGRDEVIGASDVAHSRLIDGSELDATIYYYADGALHKCLGARATLSLSAETKKIGQLTFEITATYGGVVADNFVKPTLSGFTKPVPLGNAHSSFSLDGVNYVLNSLSLKDGNEVKYFDEIGRESIDITNFKPEGEMTFEAPDLGTFDPFAVANASTTLPLTFNHGSVAGNKVAISSTAIQLLRPEYADLDGRMGYKIPFRCIDDFIIKTS